MSEALQLRWEAIEKNTLPRYQQVILPNIYEELSACSLPLTERYLCIGVMAGETAAAAGIVEMEEDTGDLILRSLYVAPAFRRKGIASTLIRRTVQIAAKSFLFLEDDARDLIQFKASYSLPADLFDGWKAFLMAAGFTDFLIRPQLLMIPSEVLRDSRMFAPAFTADFKPSEAFSQACGLPFEEQRELLLAAQEPTYTPHFTIVSGSADARETVVIVEQHRPDAYSLIYADKSAVTPQKELIGAVCAALHLMAQESEEFTLYVQVNEGAVVSLMEQLVTAPEQRLRQEQAWMDIEFTR